MLELLSQLYSLSVSELERLVWGGRREFKHPMAWGAGVVLPPLTATYIVKSWHAFATSTKHRLLLSLHLNNQGIPSNSPNSILGFALSQLKPTCIITYS